MSMSEVDLNILDFALLMALVLSAILGLFRGLVREVLSLAAWIVSFWVAQRYDGIVAERLLQAINPQSLRELAAFLILFLGTIVVLALFNRIMALLVKASRLGVYDRMLGALFGALRGAVVGLVFIALADLTPLPETAQWQDSMLADYFRQLGQWAMTHVPSDLQAEASKGAIGF